MVARSWTHPFEFEARWKSIVSHSTENPVPSLPLDGLVEQISTARGSTASPRDEIILDLDIKRRQRIDTREGTIWIEGNAILCSCPDCSAPLTMRINLAMANCWRCDACIELSPEQRRAIRTALQNEDSTSGALTSRIDSGSALVPRPVRPNRLLNPPTGLPPGYEIGPRRQRWAIRRRINAIPAWLVSMLFHLILLLILALVFLPYEEVDPAITITTFIDAADTPGGDIAAIDIANKLSDDLLPAPLLEMGESELREYKIRAEQDARELQIDDAPLASLPDVASVRRNLTTQTGRTQSLVARDPRVRPDIVEKAGGSTLTEAAVSRGLRWLASVQNKDGSWSLENYERSERPNNVGDIAGTALALLPFLGAGQTHEFGVYKEAVSKGLKWLVDHQKSDGDLRDAAHQEYGMYAHGQAAIVLIEAYAMTGDEKLHEPAQRAIRFIEHAQHERGGWRYQPGQPGDTSVFGWQLMALQSARASGSNLQVDEATLKLASYYLDLVSPRSSAREVSENKERFRQAGVLYRYQPEREPTPPMTAEAILCRMYLGWQKDDPRLVSAIDWLTRYHLPDADSEFNVYYWYYAMQALHHYGGSKWQAWNRSVSNLLVLSQETRGEHPGSWDPDRDTWGRRAGRIYVTSLAVCTLEVYYRHLPLFKRIELN